MIRHERRGAMRLVRLLEPKTTVYAHCDLPCGVYDPAQARIEAESVKAIAEKYAGNEDPEFRTRAVIIKEQRSELVKHHLWVLDQLGALLLDDHGPGAELGVLVE